MYPSSDLDSLLSSGCSFSTSPSPYSCPFPDMSQDNQARLDLNKQATSYVILAASSDFVLSADSTSELWNINGSVKLMLSDAQDIRSVVVSVLGQIVTKVNATKHITFLNITQTLWSRKRDLNYPYSSISGTRQKLSGDHHWPFSISLPKKVLLFNRRKHETEIFHLPESFNERDVRASVQYSVHLRLARGKFKADDKLRTALTCPPVTWPELSLFLKQNFCSAPSILRRPHEDPEAWYTHRGVVSDRVDGYHVRYTLSLAKPLLYARGSVIPFSLAIDADNENNLNIFSSPEVPVLRLRRSVVYDDGISTRFQPKREAIEYSNLAVWWPSSESRSPNTRRLSGELQLPLDMKPTTTIADFRIKYSVILFPFDVASFKSLEEFLVSVDIEIA